ncbi:MAG: polysulfide reductase NrfD, partial [Nitrospirae bacterium]|nr:polysulfide reductase NrfD [Nitrospirota bacterium]
MKRLLIEIWEFFSGMLKVMFKGSRWFYLWMCLLTLIVLVGFAAYALQMKQGMEITNMREQVSWGLYISNFTFLVGVAAAAVLLIIPAYIYHFKAIKKIVVFGELLAITAVLMAMLFVLVDIGRPERLWHILPLLGSPNLPRSILAWDFIVLNGYLLLNIFAVLYIGCTRYYGKEPDRKIIVPLVMISIPWAVAVHTVTAFVYNGMGARAFWNASILAPRFLASAFSSGPALMLLIFQVLRRVMKFEIQDRAIFKIAEIIAYAMGINLFLMLAEIYKEYYTAAQHLTPMKYLYFGLDGHKRLVPWIWTSIFLNTTGFFIFLIPRTRKNFITLNIGCIMIFTGVWIEKGMGLILPGFIPDALGEIYEYMPSVYEIIISLGILAFGGILYTLFIRTAIAIDTGRLR